MLATLVGHVGAGDAVDDVAKRVESSGTCAVDLLSMGVCGGVYDGDRRAAARFLLALKTAAAERGLEVSGFVPDAVRVRIAVKGLKRSGIP